VKMTFSTSCKSNYAYKRMNLEMNYELHRLYTFNNSLWKPSSAKQSALVLARIGFYYSGSQHIVICYKCLCQINCSELDESPIATHRQLSPSCLLVIGQATDNVSLVDPEDLMKRLSSDSSLEDASDTRQTVTVSLNLATVQLSLFKAAYVIFKQAYSRSQRKDVFTKVEPEIIQVDRSNPDFDILR